MHELEEGEGFYDVEADRDEDYREHLRELEDLRANFPNLAPEVTPRDSEILP
jgi:hypothetical protein